MIDRSLVKHIDWILISLLLFNSLLGVVVIYSSSHYLPGDYFIKQMLWVVFSLVILFVLLSIDYKVLIAYSFYFYIGFIALLIGIFYFGKLVAGTKSWIKFPFFQVQPSELIKVVIILLLAYVFAEFRGEYVSWRKIILCGGLVIVPVVIVALQPDLGTALSYIPILFASLLIAGLNRKILIFLLIFVLLFGLIGWNFGVKDYQKKRITTLIFPKKDPLGAGYHILQSKIALGSGGLLGKGYRKGTQSQLRFLPARHTDFVFSVVGEEFGFIGVVSIFVFYFLFLSRVFRSVGKSRDRAGVYIIFMVGVMIAFQFFINVMMTIGFFPIAGIPLPLLSYGGSSLLANYLAVALVLNVKMRRFVNI